MKKFLLVDALRIARNKLPKHPQLNLFPHYSFVVQKNKIVEWATNTERLPPIHWGYQRAINDPNYDPKYTPKFHAEVFAYRRAIGLLADGPFEIINLRLNKQGALRLSKPCKTCFYLMVSFGCKRFYYSSDCGMLQLNV